MTENTSIEWTDYSWSPWWGCVEVSPACDNCYARTLAHRYGHEVWGKNAPRRELSEDHWKKPLAWDRAAKRDGVRLKVFPSMCDPFEHHQQLDEIRPRFWQLIDDTQNLDWLLLTKRPGNILRMYPRELPQPNICLGATVESRAWKWRINELRRIPATVRFLSIEPLLEDLGELNLTGIHQVIVGAESGHGARPMDDAWVRSIKDQCVEAGIAFFYKQAAVNGRKIPTPELDGQKWMQFPEVTNNA